MWGNIMKVVAVEVIRVGAIGLVEAATNSRFRESGTQAAGKAKGLVKSAASKVVSGAAKGSCYISDKLTSLHDSMNSQPANNETTPESGERQ